MFKVEVLNRDNTVSTVSMSEETFRRTLDANQSLPASEIVLMRRLPATPEEIEAEKSLPF